MAAVWQGYLTLMYQPTPMLWPGSGADHQLLGHTITWQRNSCKGVVNVGCTKT
uniref:Uncharacterized protein n=1 Tax=Arundo donax TaxID=35708 RepID=A0A0A9FF75_ARUDO